MIVAVRAGLAYFALVFAVGFVLGTIRTLLIEPEIGDISATLVEMPVILAACWMICARLVSLFRIPGKHLPRLLMGGVALLCLLGAETVLAVVVFGEPPGRYLSSFGNPAGALGLAGQFVFAAFPLFVRIRSTG